MATINSKIEGVDVLGVVTAGETIYVGRATSIQHGIVKPAATDFEFDNQTNAMLIKLGVGLKRTADGIAIAIYAGNVVTDVIAIAEGLEIKYADIDEETENSKVIPWSEFTAAEIEYLKKYFNIEPGTGDGAVQQIGAKANGKQAAAFGGLRYDKQTGRTPTSADGNQSFAAGGSVHAEGDFSAVFGKDTIARQRASFAAGSSTAGMAEEEFNAFYWDSTNNTGLHGGSKNSDGEICDFTGAPYKKSFAFAVALGCDTQAKGARSFTAGDNTVAENVGATAVGMNTKASGTASFAEGYKTEAKADRSAAFGFETISASENGMAIGKQNAVRTDALFQVGNGTSYNQRGDALAVLKDGRAKLQAGPKDDDDIVRKEDLGYEIDFPHGEPTVRCDNTDGITVTGTMRIYLNQAKTVFHDVSNVSVEIPIFAGKNVTIDADETNKKAMVKASDIDVNTLIPLLLGSNGIKLTKNEAGDRLLIGISRLGFELGTFEANGDGIKFAYNNDIAEQIYLGASLGGAIDIYNSLVGIDNYIRVKATADEYIEINNEDVIYHTASGVKHYLREDTVKTIGGQSIYGSGDIPISGGTIDADTLIALLTGSNGIGIAKNAAGDKVNIKGAIPITVQFTQLTETIGQYTVTLRPDVDMPTGPYANWKFVCDYIDSYYDFIGFHPNGASEATSKLLYAEGPSNNVKTLFGNQSIYGSGNIDLYNHTLVITATATNVSALKALITFTSSSNTKIDSLTDLYTACSKFGEISASGYVTKAGKVCPIYSALCNPGDGIHFIEATLDDMTGLAWTAMTGITITDTVTTV